jgi:rhodanese-related sulfurtransferase
VSAVGQAAKYRAEGFTNVKVLQGGVEAWKAAGYPMAA